MIETFHGKLICLTFVIILVSDQYGRLNTEKGDLSQLKCPTFFSFFGE